MSLRALRIPPAVRVLCLAPHPDDFDAIAITLRLFRDNGNAIHLIVVSSGCAGVEDGFCPGAPGMAHKAELRRQEQQASCRRFGLPEECQTYLALDLGSGGRLEDRPADYSSVRERGGGIRPDLLLLPHGNDTNADHRLVYAWARRLAAEAGAPAALFLNEDPKTIAMRKDLYTLFGQAEAEWKAELLRCHRSQHQRNLNTRGQGFDLRILNGNRHAAAALNQAEDYAEVFELEAASGNLGSGLDKEERICR